MDGPTITILATVGAVGVALAGLILRQGARLDTRIDRVGDRVDQINAQVNERIDQVNERIDQINERIDRVERGQTDLRERMAKLEGLLEGLREAITGRRAA